MRKRTTTAGAILGAASGSFIATETIMPRPMPLCVARERMPMKMKKWLAPERSPVMKYMIAPVAICGRNSRGTLHTSVAR